MANSGPPRAVIAQRSDLAPLVDHVRMFDHRTFDGWMMPVTSRKDDPWPVSEWLDQSGLTLSPWRSRESRTP
jgi:hypothetical protein